MQGGTFTISSWAGSAARRSRRNRQHQPGVNFLPFHTGRIAEGTTLRMATSGAFTLLLEDDRRLLP
jgi:hypothetical protein